MTAGTLKKILSRIPDETLVVTGGRDHTYRRTYAALAQAAFNQENDLFSEYHGKKHMSKGDVKISVVLIS